MDTGFRFTKEQAGCWRADAAFLLFPTPSELGHSSIECKPQCLKEKMGQGAESWVLSLFGWELSLRPRLWSHCRVAALSASLNSLSSFSFKFACVSDEVLPLPRCVTVHRGDSVSWVRRPSVQREMPQLLKRTAPRLCSALEHLYHLQRQTLAADLRGQAEDTHKAQTPRTPPLPALVWYLGLKTHIVLRLSELSRCLLLPLVTRSVKLMHFFSWMVKLGWR